MKEQIKLLEENGYKFVPYNGDIWVTWCPVEVSSYECTSEDEAEKGFSRMAKSIAKQVATQKVAVIKDDLRSLLFGGQVRRAIVAALSHHHDMERKAKKDAKLRKELGITNTD